MQECETDFLLLSNYNYGTKALEMKLTVQITTNHTQNYCNSAPAGAKFGLNRRLLLISM